MTILRPAVVVYNAWLAKTGAYTALNKDQVACNTSGGTFAVALPTATAGFFVRIKWASGATAPTVTGTGLDASWAGFGGVGDSADFSSDGTNWFLV